MYSSSKKKSDTTSSGASAKAVASFSAWGKFQKDLKTTETRLLAGSRKNPILTNTPAAPPPPPPSVDYSKASDTTEDPTEQIKALVAIGVSLKAMDWKANNGWEGTVAAKDFFGVGTDSADENLLVRSIQLPQNNLTGSLSACPLHMLAHSLKFVDISNNVNITGELSSFGTCPLIEVLSCQRCRGVKGSLDMLVSCTRIQVLNLEGTGIKGGLASLATFGSNIRMLNIRETELDVTNLRKLESLSKLEQLSLGSTGNPLGYHKRIPEGPMEFDDDFLSLWFRPLSSLKRLHVLDLHSPLPARRHTTTELGKELARLSDVRAVYLRSKHVETQGSMSSTPKDNSQSEATLKDGFDNSGTSGGAAVVSLFSQSSKLSKQEQVLKEEQAVLDRCIAKLRQTAGLKPHCIVYWTKVW